MGSRVRNLWNRHEVNQILKKKETITSEKSFDTQVDDVVKDNISRKDKENKMIDIPDLPLVDFEEEESVEDSSIQDESGGSVVFGIIGAGQAGGRIAESFYNLGYKKLLVVNTTTNDLDGLTVPDEQKLLMNVGTSGAGKDMRRGEEAATKYQQEIYERMQKLFGKVDRVLVCAGAGGGTGSGACLRLVETAKKYLAYLGISDVNSKVGVLLTLPANGEVTSPDIANNAYLIASKLSDEAANKKISPYLLFDNNKINNMYPNLTVKKFWPTVNSTVTGLFHMFNVLASKPSDFTSFDPADYNRVLSAGGCMIMGFTTLKQYSDGTDVSKAIRSNLEKGLLCNGFEISTAEAAACIATASSDIL